ncbi:peroxiredoxin [Sphingobium sp. DEHP117]|jgi:peroxiredoxin (alkyl hydroperoxide reductase subunit C)|uniref:peroxiredoxin n=1 Tax=Sphingobium sp. DEHP117 TaxID=2993436 RepID=UPI0027D7441B|nr:peroxiredoxin [Sphingobium sp. DEHP117]MDQ4418974.1 peroxiredoxin [Sphingobium sp. DEHP117]
MQDEYPMDSRPPLRIGDCAPDFGARSTAGDIKLSQFRGKWLVFFSHPADFTPVCTTEFVALAQAAGRFAALGCALLGLSVDSLFSHLAWIRAIREVFGVTIGFPVIEDPSMAVGRAFGMIDERAGDSAAIRSTYFIDPEGVIRAITTYPHNVGRSVEEMLRMVAALQCAAGDTVLTPEGWQPGEPVLLPPARAAGDADAADWFCRRVAAP